MGSAQGNQHSPSAQLQRELRELCRGRGVPGTDLDRRLGPALKARWAEFGASNPATRRAAVIAWLAGYLDRLPADLRLAAAVGLGLHPAAESRFLVTRLQWLGEHVDREQRTVRRRLDEALKLLAELIVDAEPPPASTTTDGWYMRSVRTLVRLDRAETEVFEERVIVPVGGALNELTLAMSVPKADGVKVPDIVADVLYGALLTATERPSASQYRFVLQLPRLLHPHEEHRFCLRYLLAPEQRMTPHYALTPFSRCDEFELRVRFPVPAPEVWLLPGVPIRTLDDEPEQLETVAPDRVGDTLVRFSGLQRGLGYGLRWG